MGLDGSFGSDGSEGVDIGGVEGVAVAMARGSGVPREARLRCRGAFGGVVVSEVGGLFRSGRTDSEWAVVRSWN